VPAGDDVSEEGEGKREQSRPITVNVHRLSMDTRVVQVVGELTGDGTAVMQRTVNDELTRSPAHLIVDLSAVTGIDAGGINALSSAAGIAGEADISFCLVDPEGGPVGAALTTAKLTELFEIFPTVNDAVRGHRPPPQI
jgi:anti-anti-sigma regulatory factor